MKLGDSSLESPVSLFLAVIKQALTILELRSLRPGDCAILTPVPVKNDPFAILVDSELRAKGAVD